MAAFTLHPMAGAHGEFTGAMLIAAYHREKEKAGAPAKTKILIPDSAHGTNPASAALAGYEVVNVPSRNGILDPGILESFLGEDVAALMMTCPNTLGLFENHLPSLTEKLRRVDALLYYDGANMNAILGRMRVGDAGFDVVHLNLHKTFGTPHGGGGPGAGPVGVSARLEPFLPVSRVEKQRDGTFFLDYNRPRSIGYVAPFYGNFGVLLKAYAYILRLGAEGLARVSEYAVLNANYLRKKLEGILEIPYNRLCMHEFVAAAPAGMRALDIAKAMLDGGVHAPTIYFPLIVPECLMFEPTETENKETLDRLADLLDAIVRRGRADPASLAASPLNTPVRRLDETLAARSMVLTEPAEG
jgi:glycine dehydrogenase subunit 2